MRRVLKFLGMAAIAAMAAGFGLPGAPARAAQQQTLYLFNWQDYIPESMITEFEIDCGCAVVETDYDSNSAMEAKLKAGGDSQYDVVVPSSYYIPQLVHEGLIQKIDHAQIPNFKNLEPRFQNPGYDPGDQYSIPYQWGTTGIAYLKGRFKNPKHSWGILFNPAENPSYPFALMGGSGRDTIGAACAYLGYGFDCGKKSQWIAAAKLVQKTMRRKNFTGFVDGDPAMGQIKRGVIAVGMTFNGAVATCISDGSCNNSDYFIPAQGSEIWVDTMAIPAHAPNPKLAHEFINFILSASAGAELSNFNYYASPNAASQPKLAAALDTPLISPTPAQLKRLHFIPPLAGVKLQEFNAIWNAVRQH
ncbi:MAG TPA: spermidine/putrescine ABC transporter substrate-binding protein [Acetobacteraceae bacterium]|nr:spermidine/putrescine ABC transporter substrate-binding protein [Acetobacteraceae bacterium]